MIRENKYQLFWSWSPLSPPGSVLLQQTNGAGQAPLDLVSAPGQREELLRSAQVGDLTRRNKETQVWNLPLLEAGSCLLGHLVVSYQLERGLPGLTQPSDKPHSLVYKLVRALETHSLQKVTVAWTDQRAVRLVEDVETLLELSQGKHQEQVSVDVKACKGENTTLLMKILESLRSCGEALVADLWRKIDTLQNECHVSFIVSKRETVNCMFVI